MTAGPTTNGPYSARCCSCLFTSSGNWSVVRGAAQDHEQGTGHRMQVMPAGPIAAPFPRSMWARTGSWSESA